MEGKLVDIEQNATGKQRRTPNQQHILRLTNWLLWS